MLIEPYGIPEILNTAGKQRKTIDYWASKGPLLRAALNIADETDRGRYLRSLADGFPNKLGSQQVDPNIMLDEWNALVTMQQRQIDGFVWVPALNMDTLPASATGIKSADPNNIPKGAIIVTTDFGPVSPDLVVTTAPFNYRSNPSPNPANPDGPGSTWYALDENNTQLFTFFQDPATQATYQYLDTVGYMGATLRRFVRLS